MLFISCTATLPYLSPFLGHRDGRGGDQCDQNMPGAIACIYSLIMPLQTRLGQIRKKNGGGFSQK